MRKLSPLVAALLPACVFPTQFDHDAFEVSEAVTRVRVHTVTGDIDLRGSDVEEISVEAELQWHGEKPDLDWYLDGDLLTVEADCPDPSWYCRVDLALVVPFEVATDLNATTGDLDVRDVDGAVSLDTTTGDATLTNLQGEVEVELTTGHVLGRDLYGDTVDAHVTTGDIDLTLAAPFTRLTAVTTTGDIRLLVPGGTYDCTADNTTGQIDVTGIVEDAAATSVITAVTTTGDIEIVGYTLAP